MSRRTTVIQAPGSTRVTVIKPFVWTNAIDERGVVHRVVSLDGVMHLCGARCGLDGRWNHAKDEALRKRAGPLDVLTWTDEDVNCMTCIVKEARLAAA